MKKLILFLFLLCPVHLWAALPDNLISYWPMTESNGTRLDKVVASGNDLTDTFSAITGNPGKVYATASQVTRATGRVLTRADNASLSLGGTAFTYIVWVYFDTITTTQVIIAKDDTSTNREFQVVHNASGNFSFYTWTGASGAGQTNIDATTFGAPSTATWYMVAVTNDQTTSKISVNAGTQNSVSAVNAGWNGAASFSAGGTSTAASVFDGRIGPVTFWKRALSAAEITTVYNGGIGLTYEGILGTGVIPHPLIDVISGTRSSTTNATSYATPSVTIHANRLVLLAYQYARDAGQAGTTTASSTGATWHTLGSAVNYHTSGTPTRTIKVFYTMTSSDQTGAITIDHAGNTQDGAAWSLVEFEGVQTGGTDGSLAIGTPATMVGGSGATQVTCTVGSFSDVTNNVAYGAFGRSNNAGITPGSGFIEIDNPSYATPSNELETEWLIGYPTSGIINSTWAGGTDCACVGVEIKKVGTGLNPALLSALIDED